MPITLSYPTIIEFVDGTQLELTDEDWKKRQLVVETNKTEKEIRDIFHKEKFEEVEFREIIKTGQIGSGLIKKIEHWQIHVRLFQHENHIQIDAEAELSNDYIEHFNHGWISAFKGSWDILSKHFGELWVYHKGVGKYVSRIIKEGILTLEEPKSKTDIVALGLTLLASLAIGFIIASALRK